ncbi:MAG: hypothetical protein QW430_12250 [Metallosphaera sp.]|uniref:hypothetical protein n=1 Tax=Metallosphaera sp. TaxID=2020860 RepID=UPI0031694709
MANTTSGGTGQKSWESLREEILRDEEGLRFLMYIGVNNLENRKFEDIIFRLQKLLKIIKYGDYVLLVPGGNVRDVAIYIAVLHYHLSLFMKDELSPTQFENLIPRVAEDDLLFDRKEKARRAYRILMYYLLQHLERIKRETSSLTDRLKVVNDIVTQMFIYMTLDFIDASIVIHKIRPSRSLPPSVKD